MPAERGRARSKSDSEVGWHQRRQSLGRSFTLVLCSQFLLSLPPQSRAGCAFAVEILDGVLQRDAVMLEEAVELVARGDLEQLGQLVGRQTVHSVRVDRQRFERRARE